MVVLVTGLITKVITTSCYGIAHWFSPKEHKDHRNGIKKEQNTIQYNPAKEKDIDNNVTHEVNTVSRKPVYEHIDRETKL